MRKLVLLAGFVAFFCTSVQIAESKNIDFSGDWAFNESASDLGEAGRQGMEPGKLTVTQDDGKMVVNSVRKGPGGQEITIEMIYTLDGKECSNNADFFSSVSTTEWSDNGMKLTINSVVKVSRNGNEFSFDTESIWSMDGGQLVVESTVSTPRGEHKSKHVYDKA